MLNITSFFHQLQSGNLIVWERCFPLVIFALPEMLWTFVSAHFLTGTETADTNQATNSTRPSRIRLDIFLNFFFSGKSRLIADSQCRHQNDGTVLIVANAQKPVTLPQKTLNILSCRARIGSANGKVNDEMKF